MLADCVAQCHQPFIVCSNRDGQLSNLNNAADFSDSVRGCPLRYVLSDELTRLCADLAYSRHARRITYADLLHVPAERLWIEWSYKPWRETLQTYGFPSEHGELTGRRGALIHADRNGRRGWFRTFWNESSEQDVLASSMEGYFDFDTPQMSSPEAPDERKAQIGGVFDGSRMGDDLLARCFRFRYEKSWETHYQQACMTPDERDRVWCHNLGTIAMDVPMLLAFFLLLSTRAGLPQERSMLERVNRRRCKSRKPLLLEHIRVRAPILPESANSARSEALPTQRHRRLHHVRGHLVRRGNQIFWRVPHLRGRARLGTVKTRTVVWTFDPVLNREAARF